MGSASGRVLGAAVVARCRCCDVGVVQVLWCWCGVGATWSALARVARLEIAVALVQCRCCAVCGRCRCRGALVRCGCCGVGAVVGLEFRI